MGILDDTEQNLKISVRTADDGGQNIVVSAEVELSLNEAVEMMTHWEVRLAKKLLGWRRNWPMTLFPTSRSSRRGRMARLKRSQVARSFEHCSKVRRGHAMTMR